MRTSGLKLLDFNPTSEFWVHTEILNNPAYNAQFIKSTYRDNEYCPGAAIAAIEARKDRDPNWYKVYGLGEVGSLEGLIFPKIHIVNDIPEGFKRLGTGLDFGYTNDPTAAIDIYKSGDKILFDELIYSTGLLNSDIAKMLKQHECFEVIADCAEPKSIDEIHRQGVNIKPATKGKDSIQFGIDLIKQYDIYVTARSINLIKEFRNYKWLTDKAGKALNIPQDAFNHAIDACRYGCIKFIGNPVIFNAPIISF
jgi:phage terminase large subunit